MIIYGTSYIWLGRNVQDGLIWCRSVVKNGSIADIIVRFNYITTCLYFYIFIQLYFYIIIFLYNYT